MGGGHRAPAGSGPPPSCLLSFLLLSAGDQQPTYSRTELSLGWFFPNSVLMTLSSPSHLPGDTGQSDSQTSSSSFQPSHHGLFLCLNMSFIPPGDHPGGIPPGDLSIILFPGVKMEKGLTGWVRSWFFGRDC